MITGTCGDTCVRPTHFKSEGAGPETREGEARAVTVLAVNEGEEEEQPEDEDEDAIADLFGEFEEEDEEDLRADEAMARNIEKEEADRRPQTEDEGCRGKPGDGEPSTSRHRKARGTVPALPPLSGGSAPARLDISALQVVVSDLRRSKGARRSTFKEIKGRGSQREPGGGDGLQNHRHQRSEDHRHEGRGQRDDRRPRCAEQRVLRHVGREETEYRHRGYGLLEADDQDRRGASDKAAGRGAEEEENAADVFVSPTGIRPAVEWPGRKRSAKSDGRSSRGETKFRTRYRRRD